MGGALDGDNAIVKYSYLVVNTVPTRLLTVGNTSLDSACRTPLLLFIPGNPGIIDYYEQFLQEIYEHLRGSVHVCGVSHAGHDQVPETLSKLLPSADPFFYGLEGQVQHKLHFVEQNIPDDRPLFLAAHSMGCYVALQMMCRRPQMQLRWGFLLYPMLERMAETPAARQLFRLPSLLRLGLWVVERLLVVVPEFLRAPLVQCYCKQLPCPRKTHLERATSILLTPAAFRRVFHLAFHEAEEVKGRNNATIREHLSRLTFYYGTGDSWCPLRFYEDMRRDFPEADLRLCPRDLQHAFVLDRTRELSTSVAGKVNDILSK